jgi:hypothetical protein
MGSWKQNAPEKAEFYPSSAKPAGILVPNAAPEARLWGNCMNKGGRLPLLPFSQGNRTNLFVIDFCCYGRI